MLYINTRQAHEFVLNHYAEPKTSECQWTAANGLMVLIVLMDGYGYNPLSQQSQLLTLCKWTNAEKCHLMTDLSLWFLALVFCRLLRLTDKLMSTLAAKLYSYSSV